MIRATAAEVRQKLAVVEKGYTQYRIANKVGRGNREDLPYFRQAAEDCLGLAVSLTNKESPAVLDTLKNRIWNLIEQLDEEN